jgi:hypothetical protein
MAPRAKDRRPFSGGVVDASFRGRSGVVQASNGMVDSINSFSFNENMGSFRYLLIFFIFGGRRVWLDPDLRAETTDETVCPPPEAGRFSESVIRA